MQNIKVSIIVPVYNTADYIERCLDSCINQTLQEIEIIVVNACSPDPREGEIIKKYEQKFPDKVRGIWRKENLFPGGAKSLGIRSACGEFIYCLDSDDYIDLKLCEKMYYAAIAENADMAVCDTNLIDKKIVIKNWRPNGKFNKFDLCERIKNINTHALWLVMIKKSVIENDNLYFPEMSGYEDFICILWYLASKKIVRVNEALHYYYVRDNSTVHERKLLTYVSTLKIFKFILNSDYFNNLDIAVKKSLFLYLVKYISNWCEIVCINYAAEFVKFCNDVLDLFKIYKVDYSDSIYMQSEESIRSREIFRFIEQNIDIPDFNLEFAAYCRYQSKLTSLKKMRRLLSPYADKRLTLWGAGYWGKINAEKLSILGIKFEITDISTKVHGEKIFANVVVKSWSEVKERTDIVLVSVLGFFEDICEKLAKECPDIEVVNLIGLLEQ
jgi:glycosyltransferase involved in cell wall biosynthesis